MDSSAYQSCKARKKSTACASTPVPRKAPHPAHTATRMCPKNTHALDRCAYQSCPGNLHNQARKHGQHAHAQHARRRQCHAKPPTQHTQPRACAQKTRTNPLAQGLAQCARPCAVSTVHTGTLCAAVTRERAYTATGQRQKHPGNQHPPAYTSTANRRGCGGRACP